MQSLWALAVAHMHCQAHNWCYNANSGNTRIHPNMLLFSFKTQRMVRVWESHFHSWLQAKTQSQEVFMAFNALSKTLPLPPTWSKSRSAYPVYLQFSGSWWSKTYHATYDFVYQMIWRHGLWQFDEPWILIHKCKEKHTFARVNFIDCHRSLISVASIIHIQLPDHHHETILGMPLKLWWR
jgi:hypothetical protein